MGKQARLKQLRREEKQIIAHSEEQPKLKPQLIALFTDLITLITVLLIGSLLTYVMLPGFFRNFDSNYHAAALGSFIKALGQGQFPVRWTDWIYGNGGYSQPLFSFYQVGFYYLASLIHLLIPSITETIKFTNLLLWWLGGLFVYLSSKKLGHLPALTAATVFIFTPYLIVDVFVRGASGEMMAISLMPVIFFVLNLFLNSGSLIHGLLLTLLSALVLITHLPTVLIFTPLFIGWTGLQYKNFTKRKILLLGGAIITALAMSAFYWLPALTEMSQVQLNKSLTDYYDYSKRFVQINQLIIPSWGYGPAGNHPDSMSFQLGIISLALTTIALLVVIFTRSFARSKTLIFWLCCITVASLLTLQISKTLWQLLPFLAYLQFPWRFLAIIPFSSAMIAAHLLSQIKKPFSTIVLSLIIIIFSYLLVREYLQPSGWVPSDTITGDFPPLSQTMYLPKGAEGKLYKGERLTLKGNQGNINKTSFSDHNLTADISSQTPTELVAAIHYFPGWQAKVDQNLQEIKKTEEGFISIDVPAGSHQIAFTFTNTPIRALANYISLIAIIGWITLIAFKTILYLFNLKISTLGISFLKRK